MDFCTKINTATAGTGWLTVSWTCGEGTNGVQRRFSGFTCTKSFCFVWDHERCSSSSLCFSSITHLANTRYSFIRASGNQSSRQGMTRRLSSNDTQWKLAGNTIRYDTIEEFNVDWKVECGQLNLVHVTRNKKNKKKKLKQTQANAHSVWYVFKSVKAGNMMRSVCITDGPQSLLIGLSFSDFVWGTCKKFFNNTLKRTVYIINIKYVCNNHTVISCICPVYALYVKRALLKHELWTQL